MRVWYVHKFFHGEHKSTHRIRGTFDEVDKLVAASNRIYGRMGWTYEISGSPSVQRNADSSK